MEKDYVLLPNGVSLWKEHYNRLEEIDRTSTIVCLNCNHNGKHHTDKLTGQESDTCNYPGGCECQSYSPEIVD